MSVDTLTISRRRLKQIISEVVTKQNLTRVIADLLKDADELDKPWKVEDRRLEITGGESADDENQMVQFKIKAANRKEADYISGKLAPLEGAKNLEGTQDHSFKDKLSYMELADPTGPVEIDGEWFFAGGATDFGAEAVHEPDWEIWDYEEIKDDAFFNKPTSKDIERLARGRPTPAEGDVKKLTDTVADTVFMTPEITAMRRHQQQHPAQPRSEAEQRAEAQKWWDEVSAEVIEKQRDEMRAKGWIFTDELKQNTAEAVKSVAKERGIKTDVVDMKKFDKMLDVVWAKESKGDDTLFGNKIGDTVVSSVDESARIRGIIAQVIIEECLSKAD